MNYVINKLLYFSFRRYFPLPYGRVGKIFTSSFLVAMISFYQAIISPMIPRCCRFYPSCSTYAKEAIRQWGLWRGGWLSFRRLIRCHPFNPGGYDPVK